MNHKKYAQPIHLKAIARRPTSTVDNFVRKPLDIGCCPVGRASARPGVPSQAIFYPFTINELKIACPTLPEARRIARFTVPKCA
jgi:hypothetical protein